MVSKRSVQSRGTMRLAKDFVMGSRSLEKMLYAKLWQNPLRYTARKLGVSQFSPSSASRHRGRARASIQGCPSRAISTNRNAARRFSERNYVYMDACSRRSENGAGASQLLEGNLGVGPIAKCRLLERLH